MTLATSGYLNFTFHSQAHLVIDLPFRHTLTRYFLKIPETSQSLWHLWLVCIKYILAIRHGEIDDRSIDRWMDRYID